MGNIIIMIILVNIEIKIIKRLFFSLKTCIYSDFFFVTEDWLEMSKENVPIKNDIQICIHLFCPFFKTLKSKKLDFDNFVIVWRQNRNHDQNLINRSALLYGSHLGHSYKSNHPRKCFGLKVFQVKKGGTITLNYARF